VNYLTNYATAKGYKVVEVIKDVASGLNTQRKGLLRLFKLVEGRNVDIVLQQLLDFALITGRYLRESPITAGINNLQRQTYTIRV